VEYDRQACVMISEIQFWTTPELREHSRSSEFFIGSCDRLDAQTVRLEAYIQ
jgi:hypothetical protein